jgi:hypothetical protein
MAALAASAVTKVASWKGGGNNGRRYTYRRLALALTAQGTITNPITAAVLGFTKILGCDNAIKDDNSAIIPTSPSYDYAYLTFGGGAANVLADYTGTYYITVWGYPTP